MDAKEVNKRFPQFRLDDNQRAVYSPDAGVIYADRAVKVASELAKRYGANIVQNCRVKKIERSSSSDITIFAGDSTYKVSQLVLTSGPWTNKVLESAHLSLIPLKITNEQVVYFPPKTHNPDHTDKDLKMPVFIAEDSNLSFYGLPQVMHGIGGVKIGGHIQGPSVDPDNRTYDFDPVSFENIQSKMLSHFPHLERNPIQFVRCLYSVTPDERFVIGRHPQDPRVIIAAGFCGAGFKHGSGVGKILTQLALGDKPAVNLNSFNPNRFQNHSKL